MMRWALLLHVQLLRGSTATLTARIVSSTQLFPEGERGFSMFCVPDLLGKFHFADDRPPLRC